MPKYDYRCQHGHTFEVEQRITDAPLQECVEQDEDGRQCSATCKRLVSTGTKMDLKGGGWYKGGVQ